MTQEELIERVLGIYPEQGHYFCNPLRDDEHPDCHFTWGRRYIRLRDYADHYYDCINIYDMVALRYLGKKIKSKGDLAKVKKIIRGLTGSSLDVPKPVPKKRFKFKIDYWLCPYSQKDLDYWGQFGITERNLLEDHVYSVRRYKFNTRTHGFIDLHVENQLAFALTFPNKRVKIYRPHSEYKFSSNCRPENVWHTRQKKKSDKLYIFGSYKDSRVARNLGYDVRGFQSETMICEQTLSLDYDIQMVFDADKGGIKNAKDFNYRFGDKAKSSYLNPALTEFETKDVAELYCKYGKEVTRYYIENSIIL